MRIIAYDQLFTGSPQEIVEALRRLLFDVADIPDAQAYMEHIQRTYQRACGEEMVLPDVGLDGRIRAMFAILEDAGLMEVLDYA